MIEMDVLRNGKKIGYNKYSFRSQNNLLIVKNEINFAAKLVGINLLVVNSSSTETYKNGKLIKFNSDTIQNKKKKYNRFRVRFRITPILLLSIGFLYSLFFYKILKPIFDFMP